MLNYWLFLSRSTSLTELVPQGARQVHADSFYIRLLNWSTALTFRTSVPVNLDRLIKGERYDFHWESQLKKIFLWNLLKVKTSLPISCGSGMSVFIWPWPESWQMCPIHLRTHWKKDRWVCGFPPLRFRTPRPIDMNTKNYNQSWVVVQLFGEQK